MPRDAFKDKYSGEPGLALDRWAAKARRLLAFYDQLPDARAVAWLATGLDGAAGDWFDEYVLTHGQPPSTPDALVAAMRSRFQPVNAIETARRELDVLRQEKGATVNEYTTRFLTLAAHLPNTDVGSRIFQYRRGLLPEIDDRIAQAEPQPATLEATIALAARIEGRTNSRLQVDTKATLAAASSGDNPDTAALVRRVNELEAIIRSLTSTSPRSGRGGNRHPQEDARQQVPGLSQEEARRRMDTGRCLYCARTDHVIRNCRDKALMKPPTLTA
jgi:hypothetical protein